MTDFGVFAKFARTRLCQHLWNRGFRQNVLQLLYFSRILIRRSSDWHRSVFRAAKLGPRFERFSLGPPFEEFKKMADFGFFAKFARTWLCGHIWTRSLRENVLRWLHFNRILTRGSFDLCRSVCQAAKFGQVFERFSLGPPFEEFQKLADFGFFAKFARTRLCGHLRTQRLRQNVLRWFHFKRMVSSRTPDLRRSVFLSRQIRPTLWTIFSWSPLWRISENGRFSCLC